MGMETYLQTTGGNTRGNMVQAIIMAAGKSTRTYPLTLTKPKPLLKVANKTIMEHQLRALEKHVDEVIIIVGYKKEMLIDFVKTLDLKVPVKFVEQASQLGTGHAILQVEKEVEGRVIILNGDDIYSEKDVQECLKHKYCALAQEVDEPSRFGVWVLENGKVKDLVEKPKTQVSNLANCGLYVVDKKIFEELKELKKSERGEYEITDAVKALALKTDFTIKKVADFWLPTTYPWNLLEANEKLLRNLETEIQGIVEEGATIKGNVFVGKGSVVKAGAYLEGPISIGENCAIGPNCFIRGSTSIGDNCIIGNGVEVKNCIIGDNSRLPYLAFAGDSVIGDNVNLAAGTVLANWRFDGKEITVAVNGSSVNSRRKKLGAIVGDGARTGVNVSVMPGAIINPDSILYPGSVVK